MALRKHLINGCVYHVTLASEQPCAWVNGELTSRKAKWKPGSQHAGEKRGVAGLLLGRTERAARAADAVAGKGLILPRGGNHVVFSSCGGILELRRGPQVTRCPICYWRPVEKSCKAQPLLRTLDEGYLLTTALPDLQRGIVRSISRCFGLHFPDG